MSTFTDALAVKEREYKDKGRTLGDRLRQELRSDGSVPGMAMNEYVHISFVAHRYRDQVQAFAIWGDIREKWLSLGGETPDSLAGLPITDERETPDGIGRFNHFTRGSIYWTPEHRAHFVKGAIRKRWAMMGWEKSFLGYPVTDEISTPAPKEYGRFTHFEGGSIYWTPSLGAQVIPRNIFDLWAKTGHERGQLGFPTGPGSVLAKLPFEPGIAQDDMYYFEGGYIAKEPSGRITAHIFRQKDASWFEQRLPERLAGVDIDILWQGWWCLEESDRDGFSNSDEPYFTTTCYDSATNDVVKKYGPYHDVDKGELGRDPGSERARTMFLHRDGTDIRTTAVTVVGWEDDGGGANWVSGVAGTIAKGAAKAGAEAGVFIATKNYVAGKIGGEVGGEIGKWVAKKIVGADDDYIDTETVAFTRGELLKEALQLPDYHPKLDRMPVSYAIKLRSKNSGEYNLYLLFRATEA